MASECGCSSGYIENGFVADSSCKVYSSACDIYCPYYCNHGYVKAAPTVYCAGSEQWVPTGFHPSENAVACKKGGGSHDHCDGIFFENGYIVACPSADHMSRKECFYHCNRGYRPTSTTVYCASDGWVTTDSNSVPCVKDGTWSTTSTHRPFTTTATARGSTTPYRGYYDDPDLKMEIQPMIFVGAVIGGIVILGLLVFAIFFRAHKKSSREGRRRVAFIASCDPLSQQNDYTNHQGSCPVDDSDFRDIARRIRDQSSNQQQQNTADPPPYEAISPSNSNTNHSGYQSHIVPSVLPYISTLTNQNEVPYENPQQQQMPPLNSNTDAMNHNSLDGIDGVTDKPPPYESINKETTHEPYTHLDLSGVTDDQLGLPPPYTRQSANERYNV